MKYYVLTAVAVGAGAFLVFGLARLSFKMASNSAANRQETATVKQFSFSPTLEERSANPIYFCILPNPAAVKTVVVPEIGIAVDCNGDGKVDKIIRHNGELVWVVDGGNDSSLWDRRYTDTTYVWRTEPDAAKAQDWFDKHKDAKLSR